MAAAYIHEKTISTFQITWYRERRRFLCAWSLKCLVVIHILRQTRLRLHHWWFQPIWKMCSFKWIINGGVGTSQNLKKTDYPKKMGFFENRCYNISLHQLVKSSNPHDIVGTSPDSTGRPTSQCRSCSWHSGDRCLLSLKTDTQKLDTRDIILYICHSKCTFCHSAWGKNNWIIYIYTVYTYYMHDHACMYHSSHYNTANAHETAWNSKRMHVWTHSMHTVSHSELRSFQLVFAWE